MMSNYDSGFGPIPIGRVDIRNSRCVSVDLRSHTGDETVPDESRVYDPDHPFTLSVFAPKEGEMPVAEIRMQHEGVDVSLVGALTGRLGVIEVTPDHITSAGVDDSYKDTLLLYMRTEGEA